MKNLKIIGIILLIFTKLFVLTYHESVAAADQFTDAEETDWFHEVVYFAFERGITEGTSKTEYAPQRIVTRAEFASMLCRAYGIHPRIGENFSDAGNTWYTGYLAAIKQLGFTNGTGNNQFSPDSSITREEMVTLSYNFMKAIGKLSGKRERVITFIDIDQVSGWALDALAYAVKKGWVSGKPSNVFEPGGIATRAEVAQIFFNMLSVEPLRTVNVVIEPVFKYDWVLGALFDHDIGYSYLEQTDIILVEKNRKYGFVDTEGNELVPCIFDDLNPPTNGTIRATKDGRQGVLNLEMQEIIPFEYDYIWFHYNGLALVEKDGKYGFIDEAGQEVIPCIYDDVGYDHRYWEDLLWVSKDGKQGYINKTGKEIIPISYYYVSDWISDGTAVVKDEFDGNYGFVDITGKEIIPCIYISVSSFSEGLAGVRKERYYGYIDKEGNEVIPFIYDTVYPFSEGLARVERGGYYGYVDKVGNEVIPCIYDAISDFSGSLVKAKTLDGKWGVLDNQGEEIIPFNYTYIWDFIDGIALATKGMKYGYIDQTGREIVPFIYDDAAPGFMEGLAWVKIDGKYGFIDKNGAQVIPLVFDNAGEFTNGRAWVLKESRYGLIDIKGEIVAPCVYTFGLDDSAVGKYLTSNVRNGKHGVLDKKSGLEIVPFVYDEKIYMYSSFWTSVKRNGKFGFLDNTGREVIPCIYDEVDSFIGIGAAVRKDGKWGLLDENGITILPFIYEEIHHVKGDRIWFKQEGKWGIADVVLRDASNPETVN